MRLNANFIWFWRSRNGKDFVKTGQTKDEVFAFSLMFLSASTILTICDAGREWSDAILRLMMILELYLRHNH